MAQLGGLSPLNNLKSLIFILNTLTNNIMVGVKPPKCLGKLCPKVYRVILGKAGHTRNVIPDRYTCSGCLYRGKPESVCDCTGDLNVIENTYFLQIYLVY